ncbi:MAG: ABC transporter permease [Cyclobacteriaceae bacterium]|nr:ABC transporter permease [Cyclobacteriaceae bacterium]
MIVKYLQIVLRVVRKYRGYTFINILGLTIGITSSLLIGLYIADELSYDKYHPDGNRVYRLVTTVSDKNSKINTALSPSVVAKSLKESELVEEAIRFGAWKTFPITYDTTSYTEDYLLLADSNFFQFFNLKLIAGEASNVLNKERNVVITASAAKRYFDYGEGAEDSVLGKTVHLAQGYEATISGIAEDPPVQSHFHFSHILSIKSWSDGLDGPWRVPRVYTYVRLKSARESQRFQTQLNEMVKKGIATEAIDSLQIDLPSSISLSLQPFSSIHLRSALEDEIEKNGSIGNLYISAAIAVFIALLACINFINLATARSANRSKEVAVRKTVGATSRRLLRQFFFESYFYITISLLLSLFVIVSFLPIFNYISGKSIEYSYLFQPQVLAGLLLIAAVIGLIAGFYPAIYLSQFTPIEVLRGSLRRKRRRFGIRGILVVFQFFIASMMIVGTLVVYSQLRFMNNLDPGFEQDNVLNLLHTKNLMQNGDAFKEDLKKIGGVINASYVNRLPPSVNWEARFSIDSGRHDLHMFVYEMDFDTPDILDLKMTRGRFFSEDHPEDTASIILNETAMRALGWSSFDGKQIYSYYDQPGGRQRKVIGVMQDFNFQSAKKPIMPLAIITGSTPNWEMAIRIRNHHTDSVKTAIQKLWSSYTDNAPFELQVLEQNIRQDFDTERDIGSLFLVFTSLAIVIACLGLYGLASFTTQRRNKEIGIRKAMGANITSVIYLLNKQFLLLVLIGNVVALPLTWWLLNIWLRQFDRHVSLSLAYFIGAAMITTLVAILSVSHQALKAAMSNPVNALRTD